MLLGILSQFVSLICSRFLFSFAHSWFKLRAKVCIKINPSCDIASRALGCVCYGFSGFKITTDLRYSCTVNFHDVFIFLAVFGD